MGGKGSGRRKKGAVPPPPPLPTPQVPKAVEAKAGVFTHPHATCCWCGAHFQSVPTGQWECPTPACVKRQYAWGIAINHGGVMRQVFLPTPRQVEFFQAQRQFVRTLYGGAAGGAKSHVLRWGLYRVCLTVKGLRAIIIRANYKDLEETHLLNMERDAALFGAKYNRGERRMYFPQTGATIVGGHMDDKVAKEGYLSREYDVIVPDELVTYDEGDMIELFSRARTSNPEVMKHLGGPKVWAASNPGPRGALWVRDFFITKQPNPDIYPKYKPEWHTFVQAKVDDNPYIDLTYRDNLDQMPEPRRSQLLEGDWSVFEGAFFGAFKSFVNGRPWHVREVAVPRGTEWFASMDWGFNQPYVVLWWAVLPDQHLHIAYELKGSREDPVDVAVKMMDVTRSLLTDTGRLRYVAADPSMWNKTGQDHGKAIVETFRKVGLPMRRADNQRGKNGWQNCHDLLRTAPDGRPWLTIDPSCRYFLRTIPIQEQSLHDADDVNSDGEDHCLVGDTMITTRNGEQRIDEVRPGAEVWTRDGWQSVIWAGQTGVTQETWTLTTSDGRCLTGTARHPVAQANGFTWLSFLCVGDDLLCDQTSPGVTAMRAPSGGGWWDRFHQAITSTIATAIPKTTRSTISRACQPSTISASMAKAVARVRRMSRGLFETPWRGNARPKVGLGIGLMDWSSSASGDLAQISALSAAGRTRRSPFVGSFAQTIASLHGDGLADSMTKIASARPARRSSGVIAISPRSVVPCHVRAIDVAQHAQPVPIYNLTVDGCPEFVANGILVHNCADAWRYGANSRPGPPRSEALKPPVKGSVAWDIQYLREQAHKGASYAAS